MEAIESHHNYGFKTGFHECHDLGSHDVFFLLRLPLGADPFGDGLRAGSWEKPGFGIHFVREQMN